MGRLKIYVAGPLSGSGNREQNVKNAIDAGLALINAGFSVLVPHLTHFMDCTDSLGHQTWLDVDLPWLAMTDGVLRLPGESRGADMETECARQLGIPIYTSVEAVKESPPVRGDERFQSLLRELGQLHARKQRDYGRNGDPFANIRASAEWGISPWLGSLLRANDKVSRLKTYALTRTLANEGVEDSLKDLAVYALIALILHREEMAVP